MKKCNCYEERTEKHYFTDFERGLNYAYGKTAEYENRTYGVCGGTKECERCSCGGDKSKCDFYPEERKKQKAKDGLFDKIKLFYPPETCGECKFIKTYDKGPWAIDPHYCCELIWFLKEDFDYQVDRNVLDKNCPLKAIKQLAKMATKQND